MAANDSTAPYIMTAANNHGQDACRSADWTPSFHPTFCQSHARQPTVTPIWTATLKTVVQAALSLRERPPVSRLIAVSWNWFRLRSLARWFIINPASFQYRFWSQKSATRTVPYSDVRRIADTVQQSFGAIINVLQKERLSLKQADTLRTLIAP